MVSRPSIRSDYTRKYTEALPSWYTQEKPQQDLAAWDDLVQERDTRALLERIRPVPFYRYMVRYLTEKFSEECESQARVHGLSGEGAALRNAFLEKVWAAVEQDAPEKNTIKKFYAELVMDSFAAHGCCGRPRMAYGDIEEPRTLLDITDLRDLIFKQNISDSHFFMLALGLNMSREDAELFLKKVLLRTGLDYRLPLEAFLSLCLGSDSKQKLSLLRDMLSLCQNKEFAPIPYRSREQGTQMLQSLAEQFVRSAAPEIFLAGTVTEEVCTFIGNYKFLLSASNQYRRSSAEVFRGIWEELEEVLAEELEDFNKVRKEHIGSYATGSVLVYLKTGAELTVPEGTLFEAKGHFLQDGEKQSQALLDTTLISTREVSSKEAASQITYELPVCSLFPAPETGAPEIRAHTVFTSSLPELSGAHIENHSKFKVDKTASGGEKYFRGKLYVTCDVGLTIPEGTVFQCDSGAFQNTKSASSDLVLDLPVRCLDDNIYIPKNKVIQTGHPLLREPHVLRLGNDTISLPKDQNIRGGRICVYLYHKEDRPNFLPTMYGIAPEQRQLQEENSRKLLADHARLLESVLKGTQIRDDRLYHLLNDSLVKPRRDELLTAIFLLYAAKQQFEGLSLKQWEDRRLRAEAALRRQELEEQIQFSAETTYEAAEGKVKRDFTPVERNLYALIQDINSTLTMCGFHELYLPNPYDCFLAYLATCESPLDAYQNFWSIYLSCRAED